MLFNPATSLTRVCMLPVPGILQALGPIAAWADSEFPAVAQQQNSMDPARGPYDVCRSAYGPARCASAAQAAAPPAPS
eukprot:SAG22_NODE_11020_length_505_cov_0.394089_2_plen_77_part_01